VEAALMGFFDRDTASRASRSYGSRKGDRFDGQASAASWESKVFKGSLE
jgi:hypothetical protein